MIKMFSAELEDSKLFRNVVDAVATLVSEGTYIVNQKGITLSEMDPAKVAMVSVSIPKDIFTEFTCEEPTTFRVDMEEMRKIMARSGSGDKLQLKVDPKSNFLKLNFVGRSTRKFSLGLRDVGDVQSRQPKIVFKTQITLVSSAFSQAVKDAVLFSDHVRLDADQDKLAITSKGSVGSVDVILKKDSESVLEYKVDDPSSATYALNYLNDMTKAAAIADSVQLKFTSGYPLMLEYSITSGGNITYLLAPRREEG